jgi:Chloramphenicol phosphotransferase-like protein
MRTSAAGIEFTPDGEVIVGPEFRAVEAAWIAGVAAMARAGARIIVDEVFVGGAASQQRWKDALGSLPVPWVGVRCEGPVAAAREIARGDRVLDVVIEPRTREPEHTHRAASVMIVDRYIARPGLSYLLRDLLQPGADPLRRQAEADPPEPNETRVSLRSIQVKPRFHLVQRRPAG